MYCLKWDIFFFLPHTLVGKTLRFEIKNAQWLKHSLFCTHEKLKTAVPDRLAVAMPPFKRVPSSFGLRIPCLLLMATKVLSSLHQTTGREWESREARWLESDTKPFCSNSTGENKSGLPNHTSPPKWSGMGNNSNGRFPVMTLSPGKEEKNYLVVRELSFPYCATLFFNSYVAFITSLSYSFWRHRQSDENVSTAVR